MPQRLLRVPEIFKAAQTYLLLRSETSPLNKKLEASKKPIREWLKKNGQEDDEGNLVYQFPRVVHGSDDEDYAGVMLRRQNGKPYMDEEDVRQFFFKKAPHLLDRVFRMVQVLDEEEVYVLHQEGEISEAELRSLLREPPPTYNLWPVKAQEILEGEDE